MPAILSTLRDLRGLRVKYSSRSAEDLRDAQDLEKQLLERKQALAQRRATVEDLLVVANGLTISSPQRALEKLAKAKELGEEIPEQGFPDLLSGLRPSFDERVEHARACLGLEEAVATATRAAAEGDWLMVKSAINLALRANLPPDANRREADDLLGRANTKMESYEEQLLEGEKLLAKEKYKEAIAAFEAARSSWPRAPNLEKTALGIAEAKEGEQGRLEEERKATLQKRLTDALPLAIAVREAGRWEEVVALLEKPLGDLGTIDHPQRNVAEALLKQAKGEIERQADFRALVAGANMLFERKAYADALSMQKLKREKQPYKE